MGQVEEVQWVVPFAVPKFAGQDDSGFAYRIERRFASCTWSDLGHVFQCVGQEYRLIRVQVPRQVARYGPAKMRPSAPAPESESQAANDGAVRWVQVFPVGKQRRQGVHFVQRILRFGVYDSHYHPQVSIQSPVAHVYGQTVIYAPGPQDGAVGLIGPGRVIDSYEVAVCQPLPRRSFAVFLERRVQVAPLFHRWLSHNSPTEALLPVQGRSLASFQPLRYQSLPAGGIPSKPVMRRCHSGGCSLLKAKPFGFH